ncbi:DUF6891 domain-containing protein [Streptomyces sp. NPDC050504]|uniref:DUF6891 domain-containing protein n=1 Tax=Streptomyces sp. NPDC050504 TaxID=3365618 RepID=UPI0037B9B542
MSDALDIKVRTEPGDIVLRPTRERFAELVGGIGNRHDRFAVVDRVPALPDVYVQVWYDGGDAYQLEHRDGAADRHYTCDVAELERVTEAMTRWALGEEGWDAGIEWASAGFDVPAPPPEPEPDVRRRIEERVRERIVYGYDGLDELTEIAEEWLVSGEERPVTRDQAQVIVERLWLERVTEMAAWRGETDPERLARVFAELAAADITAREDFACCRGCGLSEIGAERADARGFVFFHSQSDATVGRGQLTLHYGGFDESDETTEAVGHEVAHALRAAGLTVEWDGSPDRAIELTGLDWRKRLV